MRGEQIERKSEVVSNDRGRVALLRGPEIDIGPKIDRPTMRARRDLPGEAATRRRAPGSSGRGRGHRKVALAEFCPKEA
jgi:hypothetical protein